MGTTVTVLLPHATSHLGTTAREVFHTWEDRLSRFLPDSELSRLNHRSGQEVAVSQLLFKVVDAALSAAVATDGVFDPTLLTQIRAIGYDRAFDAIEPAGLSTYQPMPGGRWPEIRLDLRRQTIRLPSGIGLDLGGIAKGMAVDATAAMLTDAGVNCAAVDAGGDLAVVGIPPGYESWPIEVETPGQPHVVSLRRGALATSGVGRRLWQQNGLPRHHLIDPRTGLPVDNNVWSASVATASCREAEIAAKVTLILGQAEGTRFLERHGWPGLIVLKDGPRIQAGPWSPRPAGIGCSRQAT